MSATSPATATAKRGPRLAATTVRQPTARARVSNGTDGCVLPGIDQRSAVARRFRDVIAAVCADLGGADRCSEARLHLIRRFAALVVQAEAMEAAFVAGTQFDFEAHARISSTLVRLASRIGMKRIARDVTPTLAELLAADDEEGEELERYPAEQEP